MNKSPHTLTWVLALIAILVCSCTSIKPFEPSLTIGAASLCDINSQPNNFVGKVWRLKVVYTIVRNHASYFQEDCGAGGSILDGSQRRADQTVVSFHRAGDQICKARDESLCTLKAVMTADAMISRDSDGAIVADLLHVDEYKYLSTNQLDR